MTSDRDPIDTDARYLVSGTAKLVVCWLEVFASDPLECGVGMQQSKLNFRGSAYGVVNPGPF
jgi:hypothetical protein